MFGCVDSNTGNSDLNQMIKITSHSITDVIEFSVQISQANQVAVSHVTRVAVVVYIAWIGGNKSNYFDRIELLFFLSYRHRKDIDREE